jgi:hypothetical protein
VRKIHNPIGVAAYAVLFGCLTVAARDVSALWARVLLAAAGGIALGFLLQAARGPATGDPKRLARRRP